MKVSGVAVIVLCSWGASILIPLTLWSAASRTGPFRRASEATLSELDWRRPPVPPQVPDHVRVVLPHPATGALGPKDADDVVPVRTPPLPPVLPTSLGTSEAADEPASQAPSARLQQPAQAVEAAAAAAEPPRTSTADAVDDRSGAGGWAGAGASRAPIFMRVPQLLTVHDEGFARRPQPGKLREEFRAHRGAHSYHYRRVMVRRWAPANPFVSLARLLFH
jgi:hypothetical protein